MRIAIHLAGRGLEDPRIQPLRQAQHVDGAMHAGLGGLHRVVLVVDRRGRAGEVVDLVDFHIQREGHVVAHELEARVVDDRLQVVARAGIEIVDAQHLVPLLDQARA